jgi:type IV secretory pathway VirB3-like protein
MMATGVGFLILAVLVLVLSILVYCLAKDSANHDERIFKLELKAKDTRP